jgi:chorismate synthase
VLAYVNRVRNVTCDGKVDNSTFTMDEVEANIVRCPHPESAEAMIVGAPHQLICN